MSKAEEMLGELVSIIQEGSEDGPDTPSGAWSRAMEFIEEMGL